MFNTGGFQALLDTARTKNAGPCEVRDIGNKQFIIGKGVDKFHDFNPSDFSSRSAVFLLTGNFTGFTAGAIFIIDQHSIV